MKTNCGRKRLPETPGGVRGARAAGGTRTRARAEVGAEPGGGPAPARDAPQLRGAASFGENLRGLHRKETRPVLKLLPRGEIGWKPPRPRSPPPPRPRRRLPLSSEAAQSFRVNEKVSGKAVEGPVHPLALSPDPPASLSPVADAFPRARRGPGPTHRYRAKAGGGAGRGQAGPGRGPARLLALNTSRAEAAERMKIFTRVGHLKNHIISRQKEKERKRSREGWGKGLILQLKLS